MNYSFQHEIDADDQTLPDPPENPSFLEIFTTEEQETIALRFERGMARAAWAAEKASRARALYERAAFDRSREVDRKRRNFEVATRAAANRVRP